MHRRTSDFVRALLPLIPLGFCQACGGGGSIGGSGESATASTASPTATAQVSTNAAPTIALTGITAGQVGTTFEYQPVVHDPDSDALQFSALNLPVWASLDPTSGRIRGTPGPTDAGVYESISITVADATHRVTTAPFSITVNAAPDPTRGVAALQWEKPSSKVSGEPLDDLAGYRILYGRSSSDLDQSVLIADPAATRYQFSSLNSGAWYFAVVAVNTGGLESSPTTIATKTL
jgi:hypothetical protein